MNLSISQPLTTCPYCGVGCGIKTQRNATGAITVMGDQSHPANFGKLCSKGSTLAHTLTQEGRLLHPSINGLRASWFQATQYVANTFTDIVKQHGPDAVAFYVSGQLLTEDYYVANKLMKGFIGSANIDTNSRLCMSSAVSAHKRAFGEDVVPACYEDLELADLLIFSGSNAAWCHPILFQRIKAAKAARPTMKVVVIDPRKTATCEIADLHLAIKPGQDVLLFNGLLNYLSDTQQLNKAYVQSHCNGLNETLRAAKKDAPNTAAIATQCDLPAVDVERFYQWFADHEKTVTCFSQGSNQSSQGTDKGNAIINCHLATGRIGKPGASPFSLTGQPNAMGGREVGGLANQLAVHREFSATDIQQVATFWQATNMATKPGYKAVDLFEAVEKGDVKAIWIIGTNPVVSLPNANQVKRALQKAELVVASDCIAHTDTTAFADVLLPAAGWGEKNGSVTNSERRISRQRSFIPPAGEAKQDWQILTDVAHAMGFAEYFPYQTAADVFREHAALSGINRNSPLQFDISALAQLSEDQYNHLQPVQWPLINADAQAQANNQRLYSDGVFSTHDGKANLIPVSAHPVANPVSAQWPLALNTGRIRDQWHTMTRTALAAPLTNHKPEPFVEIHSDTAQAYNIEQGELVEITTQWGRCLMKADITEHIRANDVFVPMHWNDQWAQGARMGAMVNPAVDPISGQPESKHTPCQIKRWKAAWSGFAFSKNNLALPNCEYAAKIRGAHFYRYEMAGLTEPDNWPLFCEQIMGKKIEHVSLEYQDTKAGHYRYAWIDDAGLESCLYIGSGEKAVANNDRRWLASLFEKDSLTHLDHKALLSGKSPAGVEDCGRTICACFGVGEKTIIKAIKDKHLSSAAEIGSALKAGTNCGSCVSEIKSLIVATIGTNKTGRV